MDEDEVREALRGVEEPDLGDDVVSLGLVNAIDVEGDRVHVSLALGAPYSPTETDIADAVRAALSDDFAEVSLDADVERGLDPSEDPLPGVKNVVAVASGKGGVGKSTISVNLAAGMADRGARVGLFDADVYGPNVPRMLGADEPPRTDDEEEKIIAPECFGVRTMSMDYLVGEDDPVIWRGPMVHKVLTQLWDDVEWGTLDYLVVDLPPGTGDTQLTLLQSVPLAGAVIVTTPQQVAVDDARKGLRMFGKHDTPVLGIVENMSRFRCPDCGSTHAIFGEGGGRAFAEEVEMPFLGEIPLDPAVREGGDDGRPVVLSEGETADALRAFVGDTMDNVGLVHRQNTATR